MLIGSCVTRNGDCFSQLREVFDRVTNTFWVYDTTFFGFCQVYKVKKKKTAVEGSTAVFRLRLVQIDYP